jgi:hypothetical protein
VLIGWWAFRLWGRWAAVVAIALASLEPTLVAHASLATGDVGVSLFLVLALYLLWEHAVAPSAWRLASSGIAVGLALVSKYSSITVLPMIALIVVGHVVLGDVIAGPWPGRRTAATLGTGPAKGRKSWSSFSFLFWPSFQPHTSSRALRLGCLDSNCYSGEEARRPSFSAGTRRRAGGITFPSRFSSRLRSGASS